MSEEPTPREGMSLVVKTVSHWVKVFALLFGIYVVLYGHLTPGGGFPGGVIMACAFILVMLAEGKRVAAKDLSPSVATRLDCVGALLFLGVGVAGLVLASYFLQNADTPRPAHHQLASGGFIPFCNVAVAIKVGCSLFMVFTVLAVQRLVLEESVNPAEGGPSSGD